jgi:nicotinate-nucleotide pyrophosphorylase (carboxylating)
MSFSPAEERACRRLVDLAWEEDLGPPRDPLLQDRPADLTTRLLIPPGQAGQAVFVARAPGIVTGLPTLPLVFGTIHTPLVKVETLVQDGTAVQRGDRLATVTGLMQFILMGERIALNFLQHLSGVASLTRRYVDAIAGLPCQILDTRKTLPGWRLLEKYAVRCGGGSNHRMGLYDGILVKDNHLAALGRGKAAFKRMRDAFMLAPSEFHLVPVNERKTFLEIEVEDLVQFEWAIFFNPDAILLDNMTPEGLREAVRQRDKHARKILLEASGGVSLETVRAIAETGVDRISVGALTHSAPALDIALDYEHA